MITRRALGTLGLLAAAAGLSAACAADGPATPATARGTVAADAPTTDDLAALVLAPAGFVRIPGDTFSGPVSADDVPQLFSDRPGDAVAILDHGFVAGTMQAWQSAPPTGDPGTAIPPTTTLVGLVLRFGDPAGATATLRYLRDNGRGPQDRVLAVPAALPDGYGVMSGPDAAGITSYTVAWTEGADLMQLTAQYMGTAGEPEQILDLALAQHRAR